MPPRSALAFQIPLNDEPVVESIDDCDLVYENEDPEEGIDDHESSDTNYFDLMDSICRSPMGHLFLNGRCVHCHDPAPDHPQMTCGGV